MDAKATRAGKRRNQMEKVEVISTMLITIALLLLLHHYVFWQRLADLSDVMHHEFFEAIFMTAGITLLVSHQHNKRRSDRK